MRAAVCMFLALVAVPATMVWGQEGAEDWHQQLDSAMVTATKRRGISGVRRVFSPEQGLATISVTGEPDLVRHVSSLPGVSQGVEGSLGMFVRGAGSGNNIVVYNGVPMTGYSHLMGMLSSVSPDMVSSVTFHNGGIDASFGDVSSSVIEIEPRRMASRPKSRKFALSPFLTGYYAGGAIRAGTAGYQVAARLSPVPLLAGAVSKSMTGNGTADMGFGALVYDIDLQYERRLQRGGAVDVMAYRKTDRYHVYNVETADSDEMSRKFESSVSALKLGWRQPLSHSLELLSKVYGTWSESGQRMFQADEFGQDSRMEAMSSRQEFAVEGKLSGRSGRRWKYVAGFDWRRDLFDTDIRYVSHLASAFACLEYNTSVLRLEGGVRQSWHITGENRETGTDIRIKGDWTLMPQFGLEVSVDRLTQYRHVLEGLPLGWDVDMQVPSTSEFPREHTVQGYVGTRFELRAGEVALNGSVGGYVRDMRNLVSFDTPTRVLKMNEDSWEQSLALGRGRSAGLEVYMTASSSRARTALSYTLSKSDRHYADLNGGEWFPFKFDRRHILSVQSGYATVPLRVTSDGVRKEQHLSLSVSLSSGNRATLPVSTYDGVIPPYWHGSKSRVMPIEFEDYATDRLEMSGVNGYKMKDYFRIDVGYSFVKRRPSGRSRELVISVYNLTNRHNPYMYYNDDGQWKQISILPVMPSVRWTLEW